MMKRTSVVIATVGWVLLASVPLSRAEVDEDVVRCRSSVLRDAGTYVKNELTTVQKCADRRAAGQVAGSVDCTDPVEAHTALGTAIPTSVFHDDPGASGGPCEAVPPSAAYYGACPAPCAAIATTDWNGVSDCMQCVLVDVVGAYADDVIGEAQLPAAAAERACLKSASAAGSRIVGVLQRSNEKCQKRRALPPQCEQTDESGRKKLRKTRASASTSIAAACAEADFARVAGCATSLSDSGCIIAGAERHGRDFVHAVSRLLAPEPDLPAPDFTQAELLETADYYNSQSVCALRSDGSAMCWGPGAAKIPGRYAAMSSGCWRRLDGSADCLMGTGYGVADAVPPSGTFLLIDGTCGLRADGTIECWGPARFPPTDAGPFTHFDSTEDELCVVRSDGSVTCWTYHYNLGLVEYDRPGSFTSVAVGEYFSCGLKTDGSLECWVREYPGAYFPSWLEPPFGTFTQVSAGYNFACAVRVDGTLACWGSDAYGKASPPSGTFSLVDAGNHSACGIRSDGTLDCWGGNSSSESSVPGDSAVDLSGDGRCALRGDSSVDCWGYSYRSPTAAPAGVFADIGVGSGTACAIHSGDQSIECWGADSPPAPTGAYLDVAPSSSCGLRVDGAVVCWNYDFNYQEPFSPSGTFVALADGFAARKCGIKSDGTLVCAPTSYYADPEWTAVLPGTFTQVAYADGLGCGVRTSGAVDCWLDNSNYATATLPPGTYDAVGVASYFVCGLLTDGSIACAGRGANPAPPPPAGTFTQLSVGAYHACALATDASVACWGQDLYGEAVPPSGTFTKVVAGYSYTCGLRSDQAVECWGGADGGHATPPVDAYVEVDATDGYGCGVLGDGTLRCWGVDNDPYSPSVLPPPPGNFSSLSLTDDLACAVRDDASLECWGTTLPTPPVGTFTQVSAGGENYYSYYDYYYYPPPPHACAIRSDQAVACWGDDSVGQSTPKFAVYQQVSVARGKSCGLLTSGALACWGDLYARSRPPTGSFVKVAASTVYACAVRVDGTVHCWGDDRYGQATPPSDLFTDVYVGTTHACGIHPDSTVACWGSIVRP